MAMGRGYSMKMRRHLRLDASAAPADFSRASVWPKHLLPCIRKPIEFVLDSAQSTGQRFAHWRADLKLG
jgi:hypothetical protein